MLPSFEKMVSLEMLKMDMNRALRELPAFGTNMTNLNHLECNMCDLESLPDEITTMMALKTMNVQSNRIAALPNLELPELDILNCGSNGITSLPDCIGSNSKLRIFFFNGNQVTDVPESMAQLKNLQRVMCMGNQIGECGCSSTNFRYTKMLGATLVLSALYWCGIFYSHSHLWICNHALFIYMYI
jgi:Leucine-rich repeat (LRR) protein